MDHKAHSWPLFKKKKTKKKKKRWEEGFISEPSGLLTFETFSFSGWFFFF